MGPVRRGKKLYIDVDHVDGDLCGVAVVEGVEVLVPGVGFGDRAKVRVMHLSPHKPVAWASLIEVVDRGRESFAKPACKHAAPLAGKCGGCPGLHLDYRAQLMAKQGALTKALAGLGLDEGAEVPLHPSPRTEHYRNRTNLVVKELRSGVVRLGSRAPRTGHFARMDDCLVVRHPLARVADRVAEALEKWEVPTRYVSLRANGEGEVLVELIMPHVSAARLPKLAEEALGWGPVIGVSASENRSEGNAVRVEAPTLIAGEGTILERYGELAVPVSSDCFLQLNTDVATEMYTQAAEWGRGARKVVDLYCGVGGLGLSSLCGGAGEELVGIEVHAGAVALATKAAEKAGLPARFEVASLAAGRPAALEEADLVLVNPPRRGLDDAVIEALAARAPERLIYMSCNPDSFARDAARLIEGGLALQAVEGWDMLPHTAHVELLALFG